MNEAQTVTVRRDTSEFTEESLLDEMANAIRAGHKFNLARCSLADYIPMVSRLRAKVEERDDHTFIWLHTAVGKLRVRYDVTLDDGQIVLAYDAKTTCETCGR